MVESVFSKRSSVVFSSASPRSCMACTDSRYRAIFVGEVRCATADTGSSW